MATTYFRRDEFVKSTLGNAVPGAQVYVCLQPANVSALPPSPLAPIFSDPNGLVPITQPILTDGFGHADFYAVSGLYTVVVGLGGVVQQFYPDQSLGGFGTAVPPGGSATTLIAGNNITIVGSVISAVIPPVAGIELQVNSVDTTSQTKLNLKDTSTVAWASDGVGGVTATATPSTLASLVNNRAFKAVPNSGTTGATAAIGFAPQLTASTNSLIAATATDTNYITFSTSAVGGNQASLAFTGCTSSGLQPNVFQIYSTQTLKAAKWQAALVATTAQRAWICFSDVNSGNITSLKADLPSGVSLIGFRYSTSAGDTTWQAICIKNGVGSTVVDTGVAADTVGHKFGILVSQASIVFQIDNVTKATITTNIPLNTVLMGDVMSIDNVGLTNVKTLAVNSFTTAE